ncbi:MAG: replicative helicase loader/inhibitor [Bacillota bacterium]
MKRKDVRKIINLMHSHHSEKMKSDKMTEKKLEEKTDVWYSFLQYYDYQITIKAVKILFKKHNYLPTVGQVINEINNITGPDGVAWGKTLDSKRKYEYYNFITKLNLISPETKDFADNFGVFNILRFNENDIPFDKNEFQKKFNEIAKYNEYLKHFPYDFRKKFMFFSDDK